MQKTHKLGFIVLLAVAFCFSCGTTALGQMVGGASVQTNPATNISSYQVTLNGYLGMPYISNSNTVYFQWGPTTSYGYQTPQQYIDQGSFSQVITGLNTNNTYHFRAAAQGSFGIIYGQDLTIITGQSGNTNITANAGPDVYLSYNQSATLQGSAYDPSGYGYKLYYQWVCDGGTLSNYSVAQPTFTASYARNTYIYGNQATYTCTLTATNALGTSNSDSTIVFVNYGGGASGSLSINKQVINSTSGNLSWSKYVNANPSDVLSFSVTLQANNQTIHNVIIQDSLPANLIYRGNLTVNSNQNYGGDIRSGINIGTVYAGQPVVISYQAQVAPAENFSFGSNAFTNTATVTSTDGASQSSSSTITVNRSLVYGASNVATGLTNNFLTDSFFLPLLMILLSGWLYFSGRVYKFADWLKVRINK